MSVQLDDTVFTVAKAAEFCEVHESVILRWIDEEGLPYIRTTSTVTRGPRGDLILKSALLTFLNASQKRKSGGAQGKPDPGAESFGPKPRRVKRARAAGQAVDWLGED